MRTEPALIVGVVTAAIALLISFGVGITDEQNVAILGLVAVLAPIVSAAITRGFVTPAKGRHEA